MWNCKKGVNKMCIYISKLLQNVSTTKLPIFGIHKQFASEIIISS